MAGHRLLTRFAAVLVLASAVASCSSDKATELAGIGTLTLSIKSDNTLLLPTGKPSGTECPVLPESSDISLSIADLQGAYAHTWQDFSQFPQEESYFAGTYRLDVACGSPLTEGFETAAFAGSAQVTIQENERTDAEVILTPSSTFLSVVFSESATGSIPSLSAIAHSDGGTYFTIKPGDERLLGLKPGTVRIYLSLAGTDEKEIVFPVTDLTETEAATLYRVSIDADTSGEYPVITVTDPTDGDKPDTFVLTPEFLASTPPEVTLNMADSTIRLPEGDIPATPLTATATPGAGELKHLILSCRSVSLEEYGLPSEADLLHLTPQQKEVFDNLDLSLTLTDKGTTIDFTRMLGNLVYLTPDNAESTFSLMAVNSRGLVSSPVTLRVITTPVEIEVMEALPAVICIDRTSVTVKCDAPGFENHVDVEVEKTPGHWERVDISITPAGDNLYKIGFNIPEGSAPANARVLYCEEIRSTFSIPRALPQFSVRVDGFAKTATLEITSSDKDLTRKITERINVYVNGSVVPVFQRFAESGVVTVIGLNPRTSYTIKTTLMDGVADPVFTPETKIVTEGTPQLVNADFEERKDGPHYSDMPSGGVYAQTTVDIFNWQHHTTFSCEVPKGWATTNEKTFNLSSSNINTWYVQPSVRLIRDDASSGSFSVQLSSVAYDPSGEEIAPYAQTGKPYLDYSPVIPDIKYRAAGKLFLGEYSFDKSTGKETYKEGISWNSRPYSLSGAYKYLPCTAERDDGGLVDVQVLGNVDGKEMVIASGRIVLPYAASFTAFNVPLSYNCFGVKACRIKVMFASSAHTGDIEEETATVATVPDPVTASSIGGRLWIDDIRLAY